MERELLITEPVQLFFSIAQVRHFWRYFWFRNTSILAPFLKMSGFQRFNCLQTQSPLLVKLSQVEKPIFLGYSVWFQLAMLLMHLFLPSISLAVNFH